jgi:hypothetical protein
MAVEAGFDELIACFREFKMAMDGPIKASSIDVGSIYLNYTAWMEKAEFVFVTVRLSFLVRIFPIIAPSPLVPAPFENSFYAFNKRKVLKSEPRATERTRVELDPKYEEISPHAHTLWRCSRISETRECEEFEADSSWDSQLSTSYI